MKYISAEQFLKANKEVQEAIIKWWKPSVGDLYTTKEINDEIDVIVNMDRGYYAKGLNDTFMEEEGIKDGLTPIPLLTLGQLIEFIEETEGAKIDMEYNLGKYDVYLFNKYTYALIYEIRTDSNDLLQALWGVIKDIV